MSLIGWILAGVLAGALFGAGLLKLTTPRPKLLENPAMGWVEDVTGTQVKLIGAIEVIGALGVVLPWLLDIAPVLSPVAAIGLALVMAGAVATHVRRKEPGQVAPGAVLLVLAVAVAAIRFSQLG